MLGFCCFDCYLSRTNWEFLGGHLKAVQLAHGDDDINGHATTWEAFSFSKLFCRPLTKLFLFCFPERGPRSCLATTLHLMCSLTPIYHAPLCIFSLERVLLKMHVQSSKDKLRFWNFSYLLSMEESYVNVTVFGLFFSYLNVFFKPLTKFKCTFFSLSYWFLE